MLSNQFYFYSHKNWQKNEIKTDYFVPFFITKKQALLSSFIEEEA